MILTGKEIIKQWELGKIDLQPFDPNRATTNSYDLTLGERFVQYTSEVIDPKNPPQFKEIIANEDGILMRKGDFLVGHTAEIVGSDYFVPIIHARSGVARLGLFVHVTADLVDLGMHGNLSYQLYATLPIRLYPGMPIGQVSFWVPKGEIVLYKGKYQGANGPRSSEVFRDFRKNEKLSKLEP